MEVKYMERTSIAKKNIDGEKGTAFGKMGRRGAAIGEGNTV